MAKTDWPQNLKCTRQRKDILNLLQAAECPLSATDIFKKSENTNLSTVYRTLDAFIDAGIAEKIELPDREEAYFKLTEGEHQHYATCLLCHRQIPLSFCPVENLQLKEDHPEFKIVGHKLEVYGYCQACARKLHI